MRHLVNNTLIGLNRRRFIQAGLSSAILIGATPLQVAAQDNDFYQAQLSLFGDRPVKPGRVTLKMPPIAENGYSVPLRVQVESPMTPANHVKRIAVLSPRNPVALISTFHLSPANGRADISTRIRLGGTQKVQAIAEMSDGSLWSGGLETVVTLAACIVL